jgi:hypothetical protein
MFTHVTRVNGKRGCLIFSSVVFLLAYHLGVTAVRAITNAFNCGEDLSSSLVVKEICAAVNTDSPGNLPSVLVNIRAGIPYRIKDN